MGLFSKCCAKTFLPVLYADGPGRDVARRLTQVVVLLRNGEVFEREYDGYGLGLVSSGEYDDAKFVLKEAYEGEKYGDLRKSEYEPQQGFFFTNEELSSLNAIPRFVSYQAYNDFMSELDVLQEQANIEELQIIGVPGAVPWYLAVACLEAAKDVGEALRYRMPGSLERERYAKYLSESPLLGVALPVNPEDAIEIADAFKAAVRLRQAPRMSEVTARFAAQAAVSESSES